MNSEDAHLWCGLTWRRIRVVDYSIRRSGLPGRSAFSPSFDSAITSRRNRAARVIPQWRQLCPPKFSHGDAVVPDLRHVADLVAVEVHDVHVVGLGALP